MGKNNSTTKSIQKVPTATDFTEKAVEKALKESIKNDWSTQASYSLPFLGIISGLLFGWNIGLIAVIGGGIVVAGRWGFPLFFGFDKFEKKYTKRLTQIIEEHNERKREKVMHDLENFRLQRGVRQFHKLQEKLEALKEVLDQKFDPSEMVYAKYHTVALEVVNSGTNNLEEIVLILKNLENIDGDYIRGRIKKLGKDNGSKESTRIELEALKKRLKLLEDETERINLLLAQNEEAMTLIDEATKEIGSITTTDHKSRLKIEQSMMELRAAVLQLSDYDLDDRKNLLDDL